MNEGLLAIPKKALSEATLELIKTELTISNPAYESKLKYSKWTPKESEKYLKFWHFDGNTYYFPRNILTALDIELPGIEIETSKGSFADIKFFGVLRNYQKNFIDEAAYKWDSDRIFEIPCGHGKTVLALYLSAKFKKKTLILVTTNYLVNQWKDSIKNFNNEIAHTLSSKDTFDSMPNISIVTLNMFNNLPNSIINIILAEVGFVVMDEGHRSGAETYQPIIEKLPADKRLCLTATFRRLDGKEKILKYHFGKLFTMENQQPLAKVYPLQTNVSLDILAKKDSFVDLELLNEAMENNHRFLITKDTKDFINFSISNSWGKGKLGKLKSSREKAIESLDINIKDKKYLKALLTKTVFAHYDNYISEDGRRLRLIKNIIQQSLKKGRTVLVLSKRKSLLHHLDRIFEGTKKALIISETNKMKPEERFFVVNEAKLILGINQLANEGLDIPRIDTVIFCHPITDTEQAIGRSGRVLPGKKQALIFYLVDNCWIYSNMFRKSINFIKINAELQADIVYDELEEVLCQNN